MKENKEVKVNLLGLPVWNENLPLLSIAKQMTQVSECSSMVCTISLKKRSLSRQVPTALFKTWVTIQTGQTIVEETELCLPVLFLLGKRQGDRLFSVTAEMKGESWCSHDGHKEQSGLWDGHRLLWLPQVPTDVCLQITDDAGTDSRSNSRSQVNHCQKG